MMFKELNAEIFNNSINVLEGTNGNKIYTVCSDTLKTVKELTFDKNGEFNQSNFSKYFPFFYSQKRTKFSENLKKLSDNLLDENTIDELFCLCIFILREFILIYSRNNNIDNDTYKKAYVHWDKFIQGEYTLSSPEKHNKKLIEYNKYSLSTDILNYDIQTKFKDKSFQAFLNYENNVQNIETKITEHQNLIATGKEEIDKKLAEKQEKVERLSKKLDDLKTGFNFVGLSDGFSNIHKQKQNELKKVFWLLVVFGFLMCSPIVMKFIFFPNFNLENQWHQMLAGLSLELILIYFFRIALSQHRSLQSQIIQLELRLSLCEFIEDYAKRSKEIKDNNGSALEKFENLIFSSIMPNDSQIPSTFDGMEQISNLIKELRSK